tara:strand:+ start:89 stop:202 length:114 start_codon:yes stop_codon:yes gene_type:complete
VWDKEKIKEDFIASIAFIYLAGEKSLVLLDIEFEAKN